MEPFSPYQGHGYPSGQYPQNTGYSDSHISVYIPPLSADGTYGPKPYPGYRESSSYPTGRLQRDVFPIQMGDGIRRSSMGDPIDVSYPYREPGYLMEPPLDRSPYPPSPAYGPSDYGRTRPGSQIVYSSGPVRFPNRVGPAANYGFRPRQMDPGVRVPRTPRPTDLKRPRMTGFPDTSSGSASRPISAFYCEICKVSCVGATAFADHEKGQRHQKRLAQLNAIEQLKSDKGEVVIQASPKTGATELRCELCDVACTGAEAYSAHLAGRQHKRTLRVHKELGKPIPPTSDPLVPTAVAEALTAPATTPSQEPAVVENGTKSEDKEKPPVTSQACELQNVDLNLLKAQTKIPVGAEYVEQVIGPGSKGIYFQCKLCECQFTSADAKELHLKGRRHRSQYKKKVDPSFEVERKPSSSKSSRKAMKAAKKQDAAVPLPMLPVVPGPRSMPLAYVESTPIFGPPQPLFGRPPFPGVPMPRFPPSPQHPNVMIENRFMSAKHASLVPTEIEAQAMKTVIVICEHGLKVISDDLVAESARTEAKNSNVLDLTSDDDVDGDGDEVERAPQGKDNGTQRVKQQRGTDGGKNAEVFEDRLLRGVVRVGALGKSLLLRGDHIGDLVLVCSAWPTTRLLEYLNQELPGVLTNLDSRFAYEVTADTKAGKITVNATKKPDMEDDSTSEPLPDWPSITVRIQLTSPVVHEDDQPHQFSQSSSGAVKAASSTQSVDPSTASTATEQTRTPTTMSHTTATVPIGGGTQGAPNRAVVPANPLSLAYQLIAQGEPIGKNNCVDALDAINQAKWFQNALSKHPLGMVSRVLLDYLRADEDWRQLDEFAVLALLDRLLSAELQTVHSSWPPGRGHAPLSPQSSSFVRPGPPSNSVSGYIGTSRLLRRFFEAISSGLLLQLKTSETQEIDDQHASTEDDEFFAFSVLAKVPLDVRERVTVAAQLALRQIAFRQLYKVLRVEPTATQLTYRRRVSPDDEISVKDGTAVRSSAFCGEEDESANVQLTETTHQGLERESSGAPPKRPCIDPDTTTGSKQTSKTPNTSPCTTAVSATSTTSTSGVTSSRGVTTRASTRLSAGARKS